MTPLTPFEQVVYDALVKNPKGLSHEAFEQLQVPARKVLPKEPTNRAAVYMKVLRQKLGVKIENTRGVGYRLVV